MVVEVRSKAKSKWRPQALDTVVRSGWELVGGVVPAPRSPGVRGGGTSFCCRMCPGASVFLVPRRKENRPQNRTCSSS